MRIALTSISEGWLVSSGPSLLLGMLLSSWSSLTYLSPVGRWLPFCSSMSRSSHWLPWRHSFLWFSCCSNFWLHWVSRSTVAARVCTCLSKAFEGFPASWLMVAIERVWTMQLFCLKSGDMANHSRSFPQTAPTDDELKSSMSCGLQITSMGTCEIRMKEPNKRHRCDTSREPSEGQVREWEISKNFVVRELGIFCVPQESEGLVLI